MDEKAVDEEDEDAKVDEEEVAEEEKRLHPASGWRRAPGAPDVEEEAAPRRREGRR